MCNMRLELHDKHLTYMMRDNYPQMPRVMRLKLAKEDLRSI